MIITGLDTETNGLPIGSRPARLLQIGAIQMVDGEVVAKMDQVVDPEMAGNDWFDEDAAKVHGLDKSAIEAAPSFYSALPQLQNIFLGSEKLVGYNISYDVDVIANELKIIGMENYFPWCPEHIDVQDLVRNHLPFRETKRGISPYTLVDAYKLILDKDLDDAHDAFSDIKATVELYLELIR